MKNRILLILVMAFVLLAVGCAGEEPVELNTFECAPTEEHVRLLGRAKEVDNTIWMVHPGTGAEFAFVGTKATITLCADSALNSGADSQARIGIYVNGKRVVDDMLDEEEKTYTVFESEKAKKCVVRVVKLSESTMSTAGITGITVTAAEEIEPTPDALHLIEFIGDSITCGYGVDDENKDHTFSTKTEDVTKSFAYKTAESLHADYSMVSISGYGVVSGYTDNGMKKSVYTIPRYYEKLGYSYGQYKGADYPQFIDWEFDKRQPDLIVINLGTNDSSYVQGNAKKAKEYEKKYVEFLTQIRGKNPNATILCTLGIMGTELCESTEKAVETYRKQTGDTNVYFMQFELRKNADGLAADWHPTEVTHDRSAQQLVKEIQDIMGW